MVIFKKPQIKCVLFLMSNFINSMHFQKINLQYLTKIIKKCTFLRLGLYSAPKSIQEKEGYSLEYYKNE